MEAGCGVDEGESSPNAAARAAGMESLKHLKNLRNNSGSEHVRRK